MKFSLKEFQLQFITHAEDRTTLLSQVKEVLDGGNKWVQLRMKSYPYEKLESLAEEVRKLTEGYQAKLIINDHIDIAARVGADGVHIGMNDMNPSRAREILGDKAIIGGTANDYATIQRIVDHVDYIGVGPFRYTTTKKRLSPTLGLEGYRQILAELRPHSSIPIVSIGGIVLQDIPDLASLDIQGIAASGSIINQPKQNITETTSQWIKNITSCFHH